MTRKEMYEARLTLVHQMHEYIMNTGDEEILKAWRRDCIPADSCEKDFEFLANDLGEFRIVCEIFGNLVCHDETENY